VKRDGLAELHGASVPDGPAEACYGSSPARQETDVSFVVEVQRDDAVIGEKKREMGGRCTARTGER